MKAAFVYKNNLYLFTKEDRIRETLKTVVSEKYDINHIKSLSMFDLWSFEGNQEDNEKIFMIGNLRFEKLHIRKNNLPMLNFRHREVFL